MVVKSIFFHCPEINSLLSFPWSAEERTYCLSDAFGIFFHIPPHIFLSLPLVKIVLFSYSDGNQWLTSAP